MEELKLKLTHSKFGFGFVVFRNTKMSIIEFDIIKKKIIKSLDKILKEILD